MQLQMKSFWNLLWENPAVYVDNVYDNADNVYVHEREQLHRARQ